MDEQIYDVVVVGGGAAGLSAALVLGRARRRVAVIDAGEPRNAPAAHMQGFLSRDGMPPADLLAAATRRSPGYGVEIIDDRVVEITEGFTLSLAGSRGRDGATAPPRDRSGRPAARHTRRPRALGPRLPPLPLLPRLGGARPADRRHRHRPRLGRLRAPPPPMVRRRRVLHAHPSGHSHRAGACSTPAASRSSTARSRNSSIVNDRLDAVQLTDGGSIPRDRALHQARAPRARRQPDPVARLRGRRKRDRQVDATGRTTVPGVWAAGNASNPRAQVITAAGEGSAAAIDINNDLVAEDVRDARPSVTASGRPATTSTNRLERTSQ